MKRNWVRTAAWAVVMTAGMLGSAVAQDNPGQGRGGFFGGPGGPGGWFGGGNELGLLYDEKVRKELDLLDDQMAKIREIGEKQQAGMRELFSGMRDLNEEQRRAKFEEIQGKMRERAEETRKQMNEVLLPHQTKRLGELARQQRLRMDPRGGGGGGPSADLLASELKLSDEQKEKLKAKAEEVQAKLREKLTKMRKEAEDEILSALTPEQRDQWKALVGEPFEFSQPQFGRRPGDDGGRRGGGDQRRGN